MRADVLPGVIVIGAMKCATSAPHAYLDAHPDIAMSRTKELNFFNGPGVAPHDDAGSWWVTGQWHRGLEWYSAQFDADAPVRGESSPAHTAPSCPEVAGRMASVVPDVRLVHLVRDPVERAVSEYAHHVRDGTERRPITEALLDPAWHGRHGQQQFHVGSRPPDLPPGLRPAFTERVRDDVERLCELLGDDLEEWQR